MTKEDRETEIKNQQALLTSIWDREIGESQNKRIVLFGFSQGVAAASRFIAYSKKPFDHFVLWAGGFAHDVNKNDFSHLTGQENLSVYISTEDQYYSDEFTQKQLVEVEQKMGQKPSLTYYDGGHKVVSELLSPLASN